MLREDFQDPFDSEDQTRVLRRVLSVLKPTERQIVELFYGLVGDGLSTKEVADAVGKSPVEVNRALKVARAKMRKEVGV